ncbi:MAG: hypothetical protein ABSB31_08450 [Dehalococcoidia bacterium]
MMGRSKLNNKEEHEPARAEEHYRQLVDHVSSGVVVYEAVITGNKGVLYDTCAAEACLELFKEGFQFA